MLRTVLFTALISLVATGNLKWETFQSSDYIFDGISYSSDRAVDRDEQTCAHTLNQSDPWWRIDLLGVYNISSITFYVSGQHNVDMTGGKIHIGNSRKDDGKANTLVANITSQSINYNSSLSGASGRYVTITVPGIRFLILCEVDIKGTRKASPFVLVEEKKTWEEALFYCRAQHRDLASILDQQHQAWAELEARNASTLMVWLGVHYTCTLDFWFWVDDHTVDFNVWDGENEEECDISGAMETKEEHHWFPESDHKMFYFICATRDN